jgi:hypothetical protein
MRTFALLALLAGMLASSSASFAGSYPGQPVQCTNPSDYRCETSNG